MAQPTSIMQAQQFEIVQRRVFNGPTQKILQVVKITDPQSSNRNVLWLSQPDMLKLFPNYERDISSRYLAVSDKVYRVGVSELLKKGMIGVNQLQFSEIMRSLTMLDTNDCVVVTPCKIHPTLEPAYYMSFKIEPFNQLKQSAIHNPVILSLGEIRSKMKMLFNEHAVKEGQSYLFQQKGHQFKITLNQLIQADGGLKGECLIGNETEIDIVAEDSAQISITEEVINRPIKSFKFELMVEGKKNEEYPFPPIISIGELKEKLRVLLEREKLVENKEWVLQLADESSLKIRFMKAVEPKKTWLKSLNRTQTTGFYDKVYCYDSRAEIEFEWDASDLTLSIDREVNPKSISFEILGYSKTKRDKELEPFRKEWLSVKEFQEKIYRMRDAFVQNQEFFVELKSGVYRVKVDKIVSPSKALNDKRDRIKRKWKVEKGVPINVKAGFKLYPSLVHSGKDYPIRRLLLEVTAHKKSRFEEVKESVISESDILKSLREELKKKIVPEQVFFVTVDNNHLHVTVEEFDVNCEEQLSDKYQIVGRMQGDTLIEFVKDPEGSITVLSESKPIDIKDPIAKLEDLGVGGLSEQMKDIVREIFLGRGKLKGQMSRRGRRPEKGILFYGPPGTGKTALARTLAEMLKGENVRMITAPEIFNKWVGESESNVRKLFEPAEAAYKQLGVKSPLFVIIIDEIDGLLTVRGDDGNSVRNSVVNQFLAKIDGPQQLNNILVIGMTNRKDKIDPAALRSGRLGLHIEIPAPKQKGREKIFEIHTRALRKEKLLEEKVDFEHLARLMDKSVGADIEAVVKRAVSYAVERLNLLDLPDAELNTHPDGITTMDDLLRAVKDVKKQKGLEGELSPSVKHLYM